MAGRYKDYTIPLFDDTENEHSAQPLRRRKSIADLLPPTQIKTRSMTKDDPIDVRLVYAQRTPKKKTVLQNENADFDLDLSDTMQKVKRLSLSHSTPLRESNKSGTPDNRFMKIPNTIAPDGRVTKTPTSLGKPKRIPMSESRVVNRGLNSSAKRIPRRTRSKEQVGGDLIDSNPFLETTPIAKSSAIITGRRRSGAFSENTLQRNMEQLSLHDNKIPTPSKIPEARPEAKSERINEREETPSTKEKKSISIARYKYSGKADDTEQKQDAQTSESAAKKTSRPLRGVTAFVDAKTTDGDEAGSPFADMLRNLGARVLKAYAESVTHVVFKDGSQTTLNRVRHHPDVKLVSLQWVQQCFEARVHLDEAAFIIDINEMPSYRKRRKSMEPKSQAAAELRQLLQMDAKSPKAKEKEQIVKTPPQVKTPSPKPAPKAFLSVKGPSKAAIELARRKTLQFAPRVSSPLAKHCWIAEG